MWKGILKIDIKEATRLGETYSPKDMGEFKRKKLQREETRVALLKLLKKMKTMEYDFYPDALARMADQYRNTLQLLLRDSPNAPRLNGKNWIDMITLLEEHLHG
tara:strand:+ start:1626 stop:1937 length:312 start_codon:yes stop_codon:yes gene_type:complete